MLKHICPISAYPFIFFFLQREQSQHHFNFSAVYIQKASNLSVLGFDSGSIFGPGLTIGLQTHSGLSALCFWDNFTQTEYVGGVKQQNTPIGTTVPWHYS